MDKAVHSYVVDHVRERPVLRRIREATEADEATSKLSMMLISSDEAAALEFMCRTIGAKKIVEVGVFTGMSSTAMACALPDDGRLVACDVSEDFTAIARRFWREAGVEHKIDLRLAPATETLDALLDAGEAGSFDFGFIDADKGNYSAYYERVLRLLRPGGIVAVDNVLWHGRVADASASDEATTAIRALNDLIKADARVEMCIIPIGDGVTFARKL